MKISREEALQASTGMLRKQVYMVHSTPTAGLEPVMQHIHAHLEHQRKMEREGIMLAAGPHWNDAETEWEGEGTFVIRAESMDHAREIASSDPMHEAGARSFKVRPWLINEGGFRLEISFSDGLFKIV